jgi:hypothetical protein
MRIAIFHGHTCFKGIIWGLNLVISMHLLGAELKSAVPQSESVTFQSGDRQTALLELFTSEGCSSCPPAEAWLSRLKGSPRLWKDFVPVAFHVDYWDYLGWRDQWGSKAFSERQHSYAQFWNSDTVYTPGFVLDGKEWQTWSNHKDGPPAPSRSIGVLKVTSSDLHRWQVEFSPMRPTKASYEVHAALLGGGITSEVRAGENRGRRLVHDFVVLEMTHGQLGQNGKEAKGEFSLSHDSKASQNRLAIAVWVTAHGSPAPLQANGGWLPGR